MNKKYLLIGLGAVVVVAGLGYLFMEDTGTFKGSANMNFRTVPNLGAAANVNLVAPAPMTLDIENVSSNRATFQIRGGADHRYMDIERGARVQVYSFDAQGNNLQVAGSDSPGGLPGAISNTERPGHYDLAMQFSPNFYYKVRLVSNNNNIVSEKTFDPNHTPASLQVVTIGSQSTIQIQVADAGNQLSDLPRNYRLQAYDTTTGLQVAGSDIVGVVNGVVPMTHGAQRGYYNLSTRFEVGHNYEIRLMSPNNTLVARTSYTAR